MAICFEKPYDKTQFICKTRIEQNGVGITADGKSFGLSETTKPFSIKANDEIECIADFNKNLIVMQVNGTVVLKCYNNNPQL